MKTVLPFAWALAITGCGESSGPFDKYDPRDAGLSGDDAGGASDPPDADASDGDAGVMPEGGADASDVLGAWTAVASGTEQTLNRVWGAGPNDIWAVGAGGTIVHFDGTAWSGVPSGTTENL